MHVIIAGAGPSGLLLALLLAQARIRVTLLERAATLDSSPRAAHYGPAGVRELDRVPGLLDEIRRRGIIPGDMCFRYLDGSEIVRLQDSAQRGTRHALTSLSLGELGKVLLEGVVREGEGVVEVGWEAEVVGFEDMGQQGVRVEVRRKRKGEGEERVWMEGDYLVGCDGANSAVRKILFGKGEGSFPGKTWDAQIVATNVYYPFDKFDWTDVNFILHPEHYFMAARLDRNGLWRVSYGEDNTLTYDEILANQPTKFRTLLPGHPDPADYKLVTCSPYKIHQRCAPKFRVGRVCLAADAAHLCNPFGGLGLTGGLTDVGGLFECLNGIDKGYCDERILDRYDEVRRRIYHDVIDPISSQNFLRVSTKEPEKTAEKDTFFEACRRANEDGEAKKRLDESAFAISHDFTQYYDKS